MLDVARRDEDIGSITLNVTAQFEGNHSCMHASCKRQATKVEAECNHILLNTGYMETFHGLKEK